MEYLKGLNRAQHEAVVTTEGSVLVIAGAGSGKTRVIEHRTAHLIHEGADPRSILLLTFTRRAAREMLLRASRHHPAAADVEGGTFHSFAYKTLRHAPGVLFRQGFSRDVFSILDEDDAERAIQLCMKRAHLFGNAEEKAPKKDTLREIISMAANKHAAIEEIVARDYPQFQNHVSGIEEVGRRYRAHKREQGALDYDDLLHFLQLALEDPEGEALAQQYRYVMVDEYQDTNFTQGEIVRLLGRGHGNVMAVGDDAQSIYGFRGASHRNIIEFPKIFSGCRVITLEMNYRSTQPILDAANGALQDMREKFAKTLVSGGQRAGGRPAFLSFVTPYEEARWIGGQVRALLRAGVPLREQAVLARSAHISIAIQAELTKLRIPFRVFGGQKFSQSAHVKDALAHLALFVNPGNEVTWQRVFGLLPGVGQKTAEKLAFECATQAWGGTLSEAFLPYLEGSRFSDAMRELQGLMRDTETLTPADMFMRVFRYYVPFLKSEYDDWPARLKDLEMLRDLSTHYTALDEYLADLAVEVPTEEAPSERDREAFTISTIHSAKGLEWEAVFVIGLMEGVLPSALAYRHEEEIEEELRLFYVALTRAKRHLFLTLHHESRRNGNGFMRPSRFVESPNVAPRLVRKGMYGEEGEAEVVVY